MSSILSQEEIDALLRGGTLTESASANEIPSDTLNDLEKDALGELANISMGSAATTLSSLLGKKVEITTPQITITNLQAIRDNYPKPYVVVDVKYTHGLKGSNVFVIHTYDAGVIVDLMMGGDGNNPPLELTDLHISAVSEAMNQMMGSAATSMSQILNKRIDISPPTLDLIDLREQEIMGGYPDNLVKISFRVVIQGLVDSEMMQILPVPFAKDMVAELLGTNDMSQYHPQKKPVSNEFTKKAEPIAPPHNTEYKSVPETPSQAHVSVAPVQFAPLSHEINQLHVPSNLDLIMDVSLQLSVELGRTHKKIREILELTSGSIIELDKLAGEPVDILVNGKLLAKGEVVVIDENFGVRVTEIISPIERVKNLQ